MQVKLGSAAAALALCLALAGPAGAADAAGADLKAEIDGLLDKLESSSRGLIKWDGADHTDYRQEDDATVADFGDARISIGSPKDKPAAERTRITLDHLQIRAAPAPEGSIALSIVFPAQSVVHGADGGETRLTLKEATANAVVDAKSGRAREFGLAVATARLDDKASGDWFAFGPLSLSYKLTATAAGGWTAPIDFALNAVTFSFAEGPVKGAIDRIAYDGAAAGPNLAALNRLRDRIDALNQAAGSEPAASPNALLDLLPDLASVFSLTRGEVTIEGLVARPPTGEPFVTLKKASFGSALTGLSGENAALRITVRQDGLSVAPALLDAARVPHRAVFDIGLEDVGTAALRSLLVAASKMREGASAADKGHAEQQMIGAAATLNPVLRLHEFALDTADVGIEATGEAKGSPVSPKGYSAAVDVAVRGFDALPGLIGGAPLASYLPLLREIGAPDTAPDGTKRVKFHLASTLPKWLTVNGNDVTAWFAGDNSGAGQSRALRPADPALTGADVRAVQQALAAAKIDAPQNGAYDAATAVAVARFQKANGLDVDGVVAEATREKLGIKPEPPGPKQPGAR